MSSHKKTKSLDNNNEVRSQLAYLENASFLSIYDFLEITWSAWNRAYANKKTYSSQLMICGDHTEQKKMSICR